MLASRELLRNTVQNVLFDAAQAYMDVIRDTAILDIRRKNVLFLDEQVRAANERFNVGENTRTDVAQARARLAQARAAVSLAEANLATSRAIYRQVIGHDPDGLDRRLPLRPAVPASSGAAIAVGQDDHPVILAAIHQADAQAFVVKQVEGELLPTVSLAGHGRARRQLRHRASIRIPRRSSGGFRSRSFRAARVYPRVRQAKELYGLRRIEIDVARDQVRAAVVSAWAQVDAAEGAIAAAQRRRRGGRDRALRRAGGAAVGQRTTLDVLDAQQELLTRARRLSSRSATASWRPSRCFRRWAG